MSSLTPPKVRIEIYPQPKVFEDHFLRWYISGTGVYSDDEIGGLSESFYCYKNVSFNAGSFPWLIFRITYMTCWGVRVKGYLSSVQKFVIEKTTAGFYSENVSGQWSGDIDQIRIEQYGVGSFLVDYIVFATGTAIVPTNDFDLLDLSIKKQNLNSGISGAEFTLRNPTGTYTSLIHSHDGLIVWVDRDESDLGKVLSKLFGGRIIKPTVSGKGYGTGKIKIECESHSYELLKPPVLLKKRYEGTNGRTIIQEHLENLNYLIWSVDPHNWFDNTGSYGNTDDRISSTHTQDFEEELPITPIQEILEKAYNPSFVRGFDIYEYPSGVLIGHLRNSDDFKVPTTISPEEYSKSEDVHRVNNSIVVYGAALETMPTNPDSWCESLSNWNAYDGTLVLGSGYGIPPFRGSNCVGCFEGDEQPSPSFYKYAINIPCSWERNQFTKLRFACLWNHGNTWDVASDPRLESVAVWVGQDVSNYFYQVITPSSKVLEWKTFGLEMGKESEENWQRIGNPVWTGILQVTFACIFTYQPGKPYIGYVFIDNLHATGKRYDGHWEDTASQQSFGKRIPKPIVDDSLMSTNECLERAKAEIAMAKDLVITLENLVVDGERMYYPSWRLKVEIPVEGINSYFRIVSVEHKVSPTKWDTIMTLSNEPQYVDFVLRYLASQAIVMGRGK